MCKEFGLCIEVNLKDRLTIIKQCLFRKVLDLRFYSMNIHPDIKQEIIDEYLRSKIKVRRKK